MSEQPSAQNKQDYPRCRTCRWWTDEADCLKARTGNTATDEWSMASAWDAQKFMARLYTEPEFGCIQHEPKP